MQTIRTIEVHADDEISIPEGSRFLEFAPTTPCFGPPTGRVAYLIKDTDAECETYTIEAYPIEHPIVNAGELHYLGLFPSRPDDTAWFFFARRVDIIEP